MKKHLYKKSKGSITVEAALILPLFLFCFAVFLYFFQIFTIQEHIQSGITEMGLDMARGAYLYDDFENVEDIFNFNTELFDSEIGQNIKNLARATIDASIIRQMAQKYLDIQLLDNSCIKGGFQGLRFFASSILSQDNIDIIVDYRASLPIDIFGIGDLCMVQRIRLRGWTGHKVPANYLLDDEEVLVYITENGYAYHLNGNCSHISFSIEQVRGIPTNRRNRNGGKYYPCKSCCKGQGGESNILYKHLWYKISL